MKKVIFLFIFCFSIGASAQEEEMNYQRETGKNELSIGALNLVAFGALEIVYERILTQNSSWAVEGFVLALNRDSEDADDIFSREASLTGKYKYFFGDGPATGFYVNGFAMLSSGEDGYDAYDSQGNYSYEYRDYTDFALGFGLGSKFVAKGGFFLDISAGIGRNLFNPDSPTIVGQIMVNLGMRF